MKHALKQTQCRFAVIYETLSMYTDSNSSLLTTIITVYTIPCSNLNSKYNFCFSFLGISIVADVFMCAIEKITSKTKQIHMAMGDGEEEVLEVPVWNGTVANLTLMALGNHVFLTIVCPRGIVLSIF